MPLDVTFKESKSERFNFCIVSNSWNLISPIVLDIPWLPNNVHKCGNFFTPDGAMDPTLKRKYVPAL